MIDFCFCCVNIMGQEKLEMAMLHAQAGSLMNS
jgi:hypothetical protein